MVAAGCRTRNMIEDPLFTARTVRTGPHSDSQPAARLVLAPRDQRRTPKWAVSFRVRYGADAGTYP